VGAIATEIRSTSEIARALAAQQHWVVSRQQLLRAGATAEAVRHQLSTGRWDTIHRGVYTLAPLSRLGSHGSYMAAVLACGAGALLSHRSSADLWGLLSRSSGQIDVMVRRLGTRRRTGIATHTSRSLHTVDIAVCHNIPCTSVARTLLDIAGSLNTRRLERAVEQAQILQLYDHRSLQAVLARASGRRGAGRLKRILQLLADEPLPTRSELERRFLEIVRRANLPMPVVNSWIEGYEVDFNWPVERLIVETDGRAVHSTPQAFERDRRRDLELELAGWHVLRLGWRQISDHPDRVAVLLRRRLY
jgi:very-short-patch-repair endonuclease